MNIGGFSGRTSSGKNTNKEVVFRLRKVYNDWQSGGVVYGFVAR